MYVHMYKYMYNTYYSSRTRYSNDLSRDSLAVFLSKLKMEGGQHSEKVNQSENGFAITPCAYYQGN